VEVAHDRTACGGCGIACSGTDYCTQSGCASTTVASSCDALDVTVVEDGLSTDDAISATFKDVLNGGGCASSASVDTVSQDASWLLNPSTGRPLGDSRELFVQIGGPFGQHLLRYLENARLTPVYSVYSGTSDGFYARSTDGGIDPLIIGGVPGDADAGPSALNDHHDLFVIETVLDPTLGSRTLVIYGLFSPGTDAGAWFFAHQMLPAIATYTQSYYVYEWRDLDGNGAPGAGEFQLVRSGG
jgi:hypothetical protein